jgi:hypothetical protein
LIKSVYEAACDPKFVGLTAPQQRQLCALQTRLKFNDRLTASMTI